MIVYQCTKCYHVAEEEWWEATQGAEIITFKCPHCHTIQSINVTKKEEKNEQIRDTFGNLTK